MKRESTILYDADQARQIPIDNVLQYLGRSPSRGGWYHCLFHDDKHPSAKINLKTNRLHCFVCAEEWSTIDIVMQAQNGDIRWALNWLGDNFGLTPVISKVRQTQEGAHFVCQATDKRTLVERILCSPNYPSLSPAAAKIGLWIAANFPGGKSGYTTERELVNKTGCPKTSVHRAIKELVDIGMLLWQPASPNGENKGQDKTLMRITEFSPVFQQWLHRMNQGDPIPITTATGKGGPLGTKPVNWDYWSDMAEIIIRSYDPWYRIGRLEAGDVSRLKFWIGLKGTDETLQALRLFCREQKSSFGIRGRTEAVIADFIRHGNDYLEKETGMTDLVPPVMLPHSPRGASVDAPEGCRQLIT